MARRSGCTKRLLRGQTRFDSVLPSSAPNWIAGSDWARGVGFEKEAGAVALSTTERNITMPDAATLNGQDLIYALDLANTLRVRMGGTKLDELPLEDSTPQDSTECVLARAFNFACSVNYGEFSNAIANALEEAGVNEDGFNEWGHVTFGWDREAHASALAAELGVPVLQEVDDGYLVPLPNRVAQIAKHFDRGDGRDELQELAHDIGWQQDVA